MRIAFFASGSGSSMRGVLAAIAAGELAGEGVLLIANRPCPAIGFAEALGMAHIVIPTVGEEGRHADERALAALKAANAELVVLSGYLRKLGPKVLEAFEGRILNVHPALLPAFGGQGMYGRRVHEAVIAAGAPVSGATVHFVDGEYDHGAVLAQEEVAVIPGETAETLEKKVQAIEPALFVRALQSLN